MINLKVSRVQHVMRISRAKPARTEWWEADDFYAWEQRKRKRAKAKGEIDSDEERELTEKGKKMKTEGSLSAIEDGVAEVEHFSD